MTAIFAAAIQVEDRQSSDVLADYEAFINAIDLNPAQRSQRRSAVRRFLERHSDPQRWLDERPMPARLVDLHRLKAWPWLTWLIIDRHVGVDLELLLAKPGGVDLGVWWALANQDDIATATATATGLGWSPNWTRQVLRHTAPVLCLWLDKSISVLADDDFDHAAEEAARVNVAASTADRFSKRCAGLWQVCFQQGIVDQPPVDPRPRA